MIMHTLSCYGWDMVSSGVLENPLEPLQSPLEICSSDEGQQPVAVNT